MLCLLEYLLTPATILRHAVLENAKAFSVHETGFKTQDLQITVFL